MSAGRGARRVDVDQDAVERDLMRLVLTVVELLRQLMERQALRRVDQGDLTEDQEERIGLTLMLLERRMAELRARHGLTVEDLNLDLGPPGPLLSAGPEPPPPPTPHQRSASEPNDSAVSRRW
ncbi:gas vesicle protein K [Streptomyces sp. 8K308]|nr:gas vesicle protein K [Streptomyces sp. 8K308]